MVRYRKLFTIKFLFSFYFFCDVSLKIFHRTIYTNNGGGRRIRTYGTSRFNGFQDRRFRPLSQPT